MLLFNKNKKAIVKLVGRLNKISDNAKEERFSFAVLSKLESLANRINEMKNIEEKTLIGLDEQMCYIEEHLEKKFEGVVKEKITNIERILRGSTLEKTNETVQNINEKIAVSKAECEDLIKRINLCKEKIEQALDDEDKLSYNQAQNELKILTKEYKIKEDNLKKLNDSKQIIVTSDALIEKREVEEYVQDKMIAIDMDEIESIARDSNDLSQQQEEMIKTFDNIVDNGFGDDDYSYEKALEEKYKNKSKNTQGKKEKEQE